MPKPPAGQTYKKKYTEQDITQAVAAIKNGMPKKEAARSFQIPRATLQFRIKNEIVNPKPGPPTVLTETEEKTIEEWIITSSKKGFPRRKEDVLFSVEQFLKQAPRPNVFIDNKPGEGWYKLFLKRHPNIASRTAEAVTSASANVSEQNIRQWFKQIKNSLEEEQLFEILDDPNRVFNGDETGFQLCPKQGKVLAQRGARDVYEVDMAPAKSSITVMFTFSASGTITPPLVIYPLKRMRSEIQSSVPSHWGVSLSENGWMTQEIFFQYITNVLHPYLVKENVVFPIILFLDGHKSHINYELSLKCKELGIVLIALYPNATRILQPADVAAFRPIKNGWRKAVLEWRRNNVTKQLTKVEFGRVLFIVLEKHINSQVIKNGFRACGLHPFNPDAINFSKCLGANKTQNKEDALQEKEKILTLSDFQKIVGADIILRLENEILEQENGFGRALDNIYKFFKNENLDMTSNVEPQSINENLNDNFELLETFIIEEQNNKNKTLPEPENRKDNEIQKSDNNFDLCPIYNENYHNDMERLDIDNSEINIQLTDDVLEKIQIDLMKELQNDQSENPTNIQNRIENFAQTLEELDTATTTDENSISRETAVCHDDIRTPIKLRDCLDWPSTPMRKGKKTSAKPLYVLTGAKWLEAEEMKRKEKEKIIIEKEQRKELREKAKQAKTTQKENKNKKINKNTKEEDITQDCKDTLKEGQRKRKAGIRKANNNNKKKKTDSEILLCDKQTTETETQNSEIAKGKETKDITKINKSNEMDMINSKKNANQTNIVFKKTGKDEINSEEIVKTKETKDITTETETQNSETAKEKETKDITEINKSNELDMINSKKNVNQINIVVKKTEKDEIHSQEIVKTKETKDKKTETQKSETAKCKETKDITKINKSNEMDMIHSKKNVNETNIVFKKTGKGEIKSQDIVKTKEAKTKTEKFNEKDMINSKENVNETNIIFKNTGKDVIKSQEIVKTKYDNVPVMLLNSNEKKVISAKKIKILSVGPVPTQFVNVKKKLFVDSDPKGTITTAGTAENKNAKNNKTVSITKTDYLMPKESCTNKTFSSLKKVNIRTRLPLPAKFSSVSVKRHSVDEKPIFSETKKIYERRATFRNEKELQEFINEQAD